MRTRNPDSRSNSSSTPPSRQALNVVISDRAGRHEPQVAAPGHRRGLGRLGEQVPEQQQPHHRLRHQRQHREPFPAQARLNHRPRPDPVFLPQRARRSVEDTSWSTAGCSVRSWPDAARKTSSSVAAR